MIYNLTSLLDGSRVLFDLPGELDLLATFEVHLNNRELSSAEYSLSDHRLELLGDPNGWNSLVLEGELIKSVSAYLGKLLEEVKRLGRFKTLDTMVDSVTDDEITDAVFNAIDDVNGFPPETGFSLEQISEMTDTRWKRCVVLRAAANCIDNLLFQWTADGIDVTVGEFQVTNKTSDYSSLRDALNEKYDVLIEKLKAATQNFSSARGYNLSNSGTLWQYRRYNSGRPQ
jgi:hypothetical protein